MKKKWKNALIVYEIILSPLKKKKNNNFFSSFCEIYFQDSWNFYASASFIASILSAFWIMSVPVYSIFQKIYVHTYQFFANENVSMENGSTQRCWLNSIIIN